MSLQVKTDTPVDVSKVTRYQVSDKEQYYANVLFPLLGFDGQSHTLEQLESRCSLKRYSIRSYVSLLNTYYRECGVEHDPLTSAEHCLSCIENKAHRVCSDGRRPGHYWVRPSMALIVSGQVKKPRAKKKTVGQVSK